LDEIGAQAGRQFDARVVSALHDRSSELRSIRDQIDAAA
jgi:HD-GYP domain-containing protein (c-di-GMP phosphodiesterase class II)